MGAPSPNLRTALVRAAKPTLAIASILCVYYGIWQFRDTGPKRDAAWCEEFLRLNEGVTCRNTPWECYTPKCTAEMRQQK
jgi:hypothetical protein